MIPRKDKLFVTVQFILFGIYIIFSIQNLKLTDAIKIGGLVITIVGITVVGIAFLQLNWRLSAFPTPKETSSLVTNGVYRLVRHPIYTGIIMAGLGYGLFTEDSLKLVISVILFILFEYKASYEEKLLENKFENYKTYKAKTWKILPFILIK